MSLSWAHMFKSDTIVMNYARYKLVHETRSPTDSAGGSGAATPRSPSFGGFGRKAAT